MDTFTKAIAFIIPHECAYKKGHYGDLRHVISENVSGDAGGLTKWGIDQRSHPATDIEKLTQGAAEAIYFSDYWTPCKCAQLPAKIGIAVMDQAVNMGTTVAIRDLQTACGAKQDGIIGPLTILAALGADECLLERLLSLRIARYHRIAVRERAKFLPGWLNRVDDLSAFLDTV